MTAVEQLIHDIRNIDMSIFNDEHCKKYLEMEKQQIIDAAADHCYPTCELATIDAEQYYNETYGSKGSDDEFDVEKEMFELEQQLDIPSHMRWHNRTSSQAEISDKPHSTITDQIDGIIFEMPFIEKIKLWELINRLVNECQTEISDEEIEKQAKLYATQKTQLKRLSNREFDLAKNDYVNACKWYREQLKKKQ